MPFWKRRHWDEEFDEGYAHRPVRERRSSQPVSIWRHFVAMLLLGVLFVGLAGIVGGQPGFEKTITALIRPTGAIWLLLIIVIYFSLLYRILLPAFFALMAWLLLTVAGNPLFVNWLAETREADFVDFQFEDLDELDAVIVLGGGTETRPNGSVQLNASGDRLAVAAQLFHAQKAKWIICTGSQALRSTEEDLHPREEAAKLLQQMGIPVDSIQQVPGNNTAEESGEVGSLLSQHPEWKRVGLITSAWHMPRALRLFRKQSLDVTPIPADFLSGFLAPTPDMLIPSAAHLRSTQLLLKEYLADWVDR